MPAYEKSFLGYPHTYIKLPNTRISRRVDFNDIGYPQTEQLFERATGSFGHVTPHPQFKTSHN